VGGTAIGIFCLPIQHILHMNVVSNAPQLLQTIYPRFFMSIGGLYGWHRGRTLNHKTIAPFINNELEGGMILVFNGRIDELR
jgi:hypothetical protein